MTTPAAHGVTGTPKMPPGQDPWSLDDRAWTQITAARMGSAWTRHPPPPWRRCHATALTRRPSTSLATQVLSANGAPYQSAPVTITRNLLHDPDGRWRIGPAVTAN